MLSRIILNNARHHTFRPAFSHAFRPVISHDFSNHGVTEKKDKRMYSTETTTDIVSSFTDFYFSGTMVGSYVATTCLGTLVWLATRYRVAGPNEYLVRTGLMIPDIDIRKKAFLLPYQTFNIINLEPITYHCVVDETMSKERISFNMPIVMTIGVKDDLIYLERYAKLLQKTTHVDLTSKVLGIVKGEARAAAGKIGLDDLFNSREEFKEKLINVIDGQLEQFGLKIYNANIEELRDMPGNEYFSHMKQRALEGAAAEAKVSVAEKAKMGNIGEKKNTTETRQATAEFEKLAKVAENSRAQEIAESTTSLEVAKAEMSRQTAIALAEANAAAEKRKLELQKEVEMFRNSQQTEAMRAKDMSSANVGAEVKVREAEGFATARIIEAEANAKAIKVEAEAKAMATKLQAEADAESAKMKALAHLVEQENEAKGIYALRQAEADGLTKLIDSAGGPEQLNSYLVVHKGILEKIAEQQSNAVRGMNPNITVVQGDGKLNGLTGAMHDILNTGVPLLKSLQHATGLDLLKKM